jgi:hypothetical protein
LTQRLSPSDLQQLFSFPNLHRLKLTIPVTDTDAFRRISERCSLSIRHLDLNCRIRTGRPFPVIAGGVVTIPLQLLRAELSQVYTSWQQERSSKQTFYPRALCPFDLKHLNALSLRVGTHFPCDTPWETVSKGTTQILEIHATVNAFSRTNTCLLSVIDSEAPSESTSPRSRIFVCSQPYSVVLQPAPLRPGTASTPIDLSSDYAFHPAECAQLDSTLSELPLTPVHTVKLTDTHEMHETAK